LAREVPTFQQFASQWFERQKLEGGRAGEGLARKSVEDLEWRLTRHLLPAFASRSLDQITVEDVDLYRLAKVREAKLMPSSINKTLTTLATILDVAVEYDLIGRNPAHGRRRRLRSPGPKRSWLDRADHIAALLDGARELDEKARAQRGQRCALIATLTFAGLRMGEALALRWRDVDLERGTIVVKAAKTDAGIRSVNVLPILNDELAHFRARLSPSIDTLVFGTTSGHPLGPSNVRRRVLAKAIERANAELDTAKVEPLPARLTPPFTASHVRVVALRDRGGATVRDGPDGSHVREPHALDLRATDGSPRWRVGAPQGARGGTVLGRRGMPKLIGLREAASGQDAHHRHGACLWDLLLSSQTLF